MPGEHAKAAMSMRERVSAATLDLPGRWRMSEVNWEIKSN